MTVLATTALQIHSGRTCPYALPTSVMWLKLLHTQKHNIMLLGLIISVQARRPNTTDCMEVIPLHRDWVTCITVVNIWTSLCILNWINSLNVNLFLSLKNLLCSMVLNFVQSSLALLVQTALQDKGADSLLQSQWLLGTGATAHTWEMKPVQNDHINKCENRSK